MSDKARIIELQRQVRMAKTALEAIKGGCHDPEGRAEEALYSMQPLDRKAPLQGLVGHERRAR
jgi:hypothetical protein